jgi:DNA-binding NtrC family response regulator
VKKIDISVKIILIDDDPDLCEGWGEVFKLLGHEFKGFLSGRAALAEIEDFRDWDILITDYYLPDLNGVEVLKKVRQVSPEMRGILLTGSTDPSIIESARQMSHTLVLHKPLGVAELEDGISRILNQREK